MTNDLGLPHTNNNWETQLQHYVREQNLLLEIALRIAQGGALDQILSDLARLGLQGLSTDGLRIVLSSKKTAITAGALGADESAFHSHDQTLIGLLETQTTPLIVEGGTFPSTLAGFGGHYQSLIALPLMAHGARCGVLWAACAKPHVFTAAERNFALILAAQTAVAIANGHAFEEARYERERLAAILTSSGDPVLVTNATNQIILLNPAAEDVFKVTAAQALGKSADEAFKDAEAEPLVALLRDGGVDNIEWRSLEGHYFAPRVSDIVDTSQGRIGRVLMLRDISRYRRLRDNQKEMTSTISHDMRNPLTFMRGYVNILSGTESSIPKFHEMLGKIETGITYVNDLIDKIVDANRFDADGNYRLSREPVDISQMISDIVNFYRPAAEKKKINLSLDLAPNLPVMNLDESMKRALGNLVDNAIKYTPDGGKVTVTALISDEQVRIHVADTGLGISEENQKKLFELFTRLRRKEHDRVPGSGLGLYNVRRIAQRHLGDATLVSKEGVGSTFTLHIPLVDENLMGGKAT